MKNFALALLLSASASQAIAHDKSSAENMGTAMESALSNLGSLMDTRLEETPGVVYAKVSVYEDHMHLNVVTLAPSSTGNLYDRDILQRQLPYLEGYIIEAASGFDQASLLLPSFQGQNIYNKACANVRRAYTKLAIAKEKSKSADVFQNGDFDALEIDLVEALVENNCQ